MAFEAGSVVMLKSGGQPMTVVSASDEDVECIWIGEEGEFFRHSIPAIALEAAIPADEDEDEEEGDEEEENEDETSDDGAEDEAAKRSAA